MSTLRFYSGIALLAASVALVACAGDPTPQATAQYDTDDASLNTHVQAAITGVPGMHADTTQVTTHDRVVQLRGTADNQLAAQNAVQAARQVPGVKTVDYDIKVAPQ